MTTPRRCADCGTPAEPGQSFCDACGAVLSWTDRAATRAPVAAPAADAGRPAGSGEAAQQDGAVSSALPEGSWGPGAAEASPARPGGPVTGSGDGVPAVSGAPVPGTAGLPPEDGAAAPSGGDHRPDDAGTGQARSAGPVPAAAPEAAAPAPHDTVFRAGPPAPGAAVPGPGGDASVDDSAPTEPLPTAAGAHGPGGLPGDSRPGDNWSGDDRPGDGTSGDGMTDRARRLIVPVSDPDPRPAPEPTVAPVLPGRPVAQRPQTVRAPGEDLGAEGGVPCPWCATRNRPDRHYCTRCAMPMAGERGEQAPGRRPWWRRLWGADDREAPWAGERPRLRRTFGRVLGWLGAAVVLVLLVVLGMKIPDAVQATRDHFAKRAPISPDHVAASRSYPDHGAQLAFDKLNNTWWGPGVSQAGQGQWIEARFSEPTRLLDVVITPGVSTHADQLSQSALPHRIEARITLADGRTTTRDIVLDQGAGPQTRSFRVGEVTAVRFVLQSAYQISASKQVSIAEIEFFGPSQGGGS
ncbi:zinc ribbon domain-containing protein [Streptomyces thermodiastaticus]|uniref:zinc ribbon domain-containing protein n=1 Tax=Streptomyces thermodiastaticus TaxID=44061 RepID=UPI001F2CE33E|nr:zinc ribbon domain-containing protein [Streptomyces thermodiastaticus]MCE7553147.1 zinc ribbon domain-containing protein [Streptomyces thermodiastaticus]